MAQFLALSSCSKKVLDLKDSGLMSFYMYFAFAPSACSKIFVTTLTYGMIYKVFNKLYRFCHISRLKRTLVEKNFDIF